MKLRMLGFGTLLLLGSASASEAAREVASGAGEREATALTVYNDNLALVKERRRVALPAGLTRLSLRDVSGQMRPETAFLRAVTGNPVTLIEQNFDFDLLTPGKLLEKYVGREVTVIRTHPTSGEEQREKATVLSANGGTVLRFPDRIETGVPGRIVFDAVPANLRDRPTLSILVEAAGGPQSLELSYLSGGLSWKADYVVNLSPDGKSADLSGWVTLTNFSGAGYDSATLQLVAGTVHRVRPQQEIMAYGMATPAAAPRKMEPTQEALMDYHLYSFERPTSLADNQTKQLALLSASAIPVRRSYLLAGSDWYYRERSGQIGQNLKPAIKMEFDNRGGQLGKPLPGGVVRVYARDAKGAAQFVGEDRIQHTARNEKVKLQLGEAFDITAERRQTAYRRLGDNMAESSYRIELRSGKDEAVTVRIQEPLPGDWEMVRENHKHRQESSRIAAWDVDVPANGTAILEYTVRTQW